MEAISSLLTSTDASVEVNKELIASIKEGALVFVGFDKDDSTHKVESLADKLIRYKIFNDKKGLFYH